jgi:hypothetical protein
MKNKGGKEIFNARQKLNYIRVHVLIAVATKMSIFWDITPPHSGFLFGLHFNLEDGSDTSLRNVG